MVKMMKCEVCGCTAEVSGSDGSTMTCCGQPMTPGAVLVSDRDLEDAALWGDDEWDWEGLRDDDCPESGAVRDVTVNVQAIPGAVAVPLAMAACLCGSVIALGFAFSRQARILRR